MKMDSSRRKLRRLPTLIDHDQREKESRAEAKPQIARGRELHPVRRADARVVHFVGAIPARRRVIAVEDCLQARSRLWWRGVAQQQVAHLRESLIQQVEPSPRGRAVYITVVGAEADTPQVVGRAGFGQQLVARVQKEPTCTTFSRSDPTHRRRSPGTSYHTACG